ncbi:15595_t:CDS:1, partial [Gigaspora rosea]
GLGRKIMIEAIEDSNEDTYHELLGFFISIQRKTSQRIINNTNNSI